ncbi:MAG: SRPBCC family protein [Granulosicoccus sp.]
MSMAITHAITISASAQTIFDIYKDIESWPKWDPDLESVSLDGTFSLGATGWIKPQGAPRS